MTKRPDLRFRYFIVKHPTDYAIHEGYEDRQGNIIGVNGEPVAFIGYSVEELLDILKILAKDITKDSTVVHGNCAHLYEAFDNIIYHNFDALLIPKTSNNVIPFRKI